MSLTLNMVGGGSGGGISANSAVLHVDATYGSTVSITNGTTTKTQDYTKSHKSNTDPNRADYYFSIPSSGYGTWTITVTLGESTVSDTVEITTNRQYDYHSIYWLFRDGDTCDTVTGGWSASGWVATGTRGVNAGSITNNKISVTGANGSPGKPGNLATVNKIDVTNFSKLVYVGDRISQTNNTCIQSTGLHPTKTVIDTAVYFNQNGTGSFTKELDISNVAGSYYVNFNVGESASCSATCSQIYLI